MKIVSFNVNGLRAILNKNFESIFDSFDATIFSLNETKLSKSFNDLNFNKIGYEVYYTNSKIRKGYSGVCVFTKVKPLSVWYGLDNHKYDDEGRVITLEFDKFYYIACYVPNSGEGLKRLMFRLEFESDLLNYITRLDKIKPIIYAGDLNCAHKEIDIKNPKANERNAGFTIEERNAFSNLLQHGFTDIFRYLNPNKIKYSWWSYRFNARINNAGWRIDYFIISDRIINKVISTDICTQILGSDHCPIVLEIDF